MKAFEITLIHRTDNKSFAAKGQTIYVVEADDLVELLAKFQIKLLLIQRDIHAKEINELNSRLVSDDDVPF